MIAFVLENLWIFYIIAGIFFLLLEIATPSLFFLPVALGAFATIPLSFVLSFSLTILTWGALSGGSYLIIKKLFANSQKVKLRTGVDGFIGKTGVVTQAINPVTGQGRVKLYGDEWNVFQADESIEEGEQIKILGFQGNRVRVEKIINIDEQLEKNFDQKLQT